MSNKVIRCSGHSIMKKLFARYQKLFTRDLAMRIQAEFNLIWLEVGDDLDGMINERSYLYDALIECYQDP